MERRRHDEVGFLRLEKYMQRVLRFYSYAQFQYQHIKSRRTQVEPQSEKQYHIASYEQFFQAEHTHLQHRQATIYHFTNLVLIYSSSASSADAAAKERWSGSNGLQ
jgi:hypothetical protein